MDVKNKVLNYINQHRLLSFGDSVICAVSGGADSVCMLDILISLKDELSLTLYVAHINHGLRGEEATRDELFVKNLCEKYTLPFYCKRVDVNELSKKLKISCEEAGRIARYEFFSELKKDLSAVKVSTAHNKNDNAETVLMRIIRGTDLKGLSGIPVLNSDNVIRPILCLERDEIIAYLRCKGLEFVTDSTNLENDFTRNKIRNKLIPTIIEEYNRAFIDTFSSNIELYNESNNFIETYVKSRFDKLVKKEAFGFSFSVESLLAEHSYIAKRIIKKSVSNLTELNITNNLCNMIYDNLTKDTVLSINKKLTLYIKYKMVYFVINRDKTDFIYNFKEFGKYYIPEISAYLDIEEFRGTPCYNNKYSIFIPFEEDTRFTLRSKKNGDRIKLINCGQKKVNDIMIDEKIPFFLRDYFPVLEYNDRIIWVCGIRDNVPRQKNINEKYIKITLHKEKQNA